MVAIASGVLLYKSHIFWEGSVSQAHAVCQFAGPFLALGGQKAVDTCSRANILFYVFLIGMWGSIITGTVAGVKLWRKHKE